MPPARSGRRLAKNKGLQAARALASTPTANAIPYPSVRRWEREKSPSPAPACDTRPGRPYQRALFGDAQEGDVRFGEKPLPLGGRKGERGFSLDEKATAAPGFPAQRVQAAQHGPAAGVRACRALVRVGTGLAWQRGRFRVAAAGRLASGDCPNVAQSGTASW